MSRAIRSITRSVRGVVDSFTGRSQEDLIKEQRKAEEERIRKEEEARKQAEQKKLEEEAYQKQVQAQKDKITQEQLTQQQASENAGTGDLDSSNVGLGDVKVDFGKLMTSAEDDEDKLKKALR